MKYALSSLAGALTAVAGVVLAGHWPALFIVLGFVLSSAGWVMFLKFAIGRGWLRLNFGRQTGLTPSAPVQAGGRALAGRSVRKPCFERSKLRRGRLSSRTGRLTAYNLSMLPQVEQDVISGLMGLGCSFTEASTAVQTARSGAPGSQSFDELFRTATAVLNAGKHATRRAAA